MTSAGISSTTAKIPSGTITIDRLAGIAMLREALAWCECHGASALFPDVFDDS